MAAQRRIQKELLDIQKEASPNYSISISEANIFLWSGDIIGPIKSPYSSGVFKIKIEFPIDFPFKAPKINFQTKIYHPNIDDDGSICVDILKADMWKPSTKLIDVFATLIDLLENPNPDDPLQPSIAELYKSDQTTFNKNAKDWVKKYCGK